MHSSKKGDLKDRAKINYKNLMWELVCYVQLSERSMITNGGEWYKRELNRS